MMMDGRLKMMSRKLTMMRTVLISMAASFLSCPSVKGVLASLASPVAE